MPSDEEKLFFQRAFRLIDRERQSHWYDIYNFSISQSPDGRIDWGLIPDLISVHYNGYGYVKAVNRVTTILLEIIEEDPNDQRLQQKLLPLALLANVIYEIRRGGLLAHGDEETGDSGHAVACNAWREASEAMAHVVHFQTPSEIIKKARRILFGLGLAISSCAGAWYLISQFQG